MEKPILVGGKFDIQTILDSGKYQIGYKIFEHGASGNYINFLGNSKYVPHKWHEVIKVNTSSNGPGLNLFRTKEDCLEFVDYDYTDDTEFWEFVVPIDENIITETNEEGGFRCKFAYMYRKVDDKTSDFTYSTESSESEINLLCEYSTEFMESIRDGIININLTNHQKHLLLKYQDYYDETFDFTCLDELEIDDLCEICPKFAELIRDGIINIELTNHQKHILLILQQYYDKTLDLTCLSKYEIEGLCMYSPKFVELIRDGIINIKLTNYQKCLLISHHNYYDKTLDFTQLTDWQIDSLCDSPRFVELIRDGIINIQLTDHQKYILLRWQDYYDKTLNFIRLVEFEINELCRFSPKFMELIRDGIVNIELTNYQKCLLFCYQNYYDKTLDVTCLTESQINNICVVNRKTAELIRGNLADNPKVESLRMKFGLVQFDDVNWEYMDELYIIKNYVHVHN